MKLLSGTINSKFKIQAHWRVRDTTAPLSSLIYNRLQGRKVFDDFFVCSTVTFEQVFRFSQFFLRWEGFIISLLILLSSTILKFVCLPV